MGAHASTNVCGVQRSDYTSYSTGGAPEASAVLSATPGTLIMLTGYSTAAGYVLLFDSASVPIDTTVPKYRLAVAANDNFSFLIPVCGLPEFKNGFSVCFSSTIATKTLGAAACYFQAFFI